MKKVLIIFLLVLTALITSPEAFAKRTKSIYSTQGTGYVSPPTTRVHAYIKKNGKYVASHRRTRPDATKIDNFSTKGNVNPDNGKAGAVTPNITVGK